MFICRECYLKNTNDSFWWDIAPKSNGGCEDCGSSKTCADIFHSKIPVKEQITSDDGMAVKVLIEKSGDQWVKIDDLITWAKKVQADNGQSQDFHFLIKELIKLKNQKAT